MNSGGEVIGINTAIFSRSGGSQGIGFAIPVNQAKRVAAELIASGRYARPWVGITGIALGKEFSKTLQMGINKGVLTVDVIRGGPADKAGIRGGHTDLIYGNMRFSVGGDVIVSVNETAIEDMDQLIEAINRHRVGDELHFKIWRENIGYIDRKVILEEALG